MYKVDYNLIENRRIFFKDTSKIGSYEMRKSLCQLKKKWSLDIFVSKSLLKSTIDMSDKCEDVYQNI